jgi:signal transduction histidine kinase
VSSHPCQGEDIVPKQSSETVEPADAAVPAQRGRTNLTSSPSHPLDAAALPARIAERGANGGPTLTANPVLEPWPVRPGSGNPHHTTGRHPARDQRADRSRRAELTGWARRHRVLLLDILAIVAAALDVALVVPPDTPVYSLVLSVVSVAGLLLRRKYPFLAALISIPGFLAGWSELAPMIALGTLAWRYARGWQTVVAACGIWFCRFFVWPASDFATLPWTEHLHDGIYACIVVAMPVAIGLLITARHDLSARIVELAASRERERRLEAANVRADERAIIARDMHDVVSHQVSLIAMQAGALSVTATDPVSRETAATIRVLSHRTLNELRDLVGAWRTADTPSADLDGLLQLVRDSAVQVDLDLDLHGTELPGPIAGAAYRTVQEALTNARKYAAEAPATVRVAVHGGELLVVVANEAPAPCNRTERPAEWPLPSGGHGLVGLRERADLLGGRFEATGTETGGFVVRAAFPLPENTLTTQNAVPEQAAQS